MRENIYYDTHINHIHNETKYTFTESKEELFKRSLTSYGTNIIFEDDKWYCDKLIRNENQSAKHNTVYFTNVPKKYVDDIKYFTIYQLSTNSVKDSKDKVGYICKLFEFLDKEKLEFKNLNRSSETGFIDFLDNLRKEDGDKLSVSYKNMIFNACKNYIDFIISFREYNSISPFSTKRNPYKDKISRKKEYKYIPDDIIEQLDVAFKRDDVPATLKTFYWIARCIPLRVSEITEMNLNCLKPYGENSYVITIPTRKQAGGYKDFQKRLITLNYVGHGKYIIDLIKNQIEYSKSIQDKLPEEQRGFLFSYQVYGHNTKHYNKTGEHKFYLTKAYTVFNSDIVAERLRKFCSLYEIKNEDGTIYKVTSHQFRHNGITERIYAGFSVLQIMLMTDHQNDEMITKTYTHRKNKSLLETQRLVNNEELPSDDEDKPVIFKGRILNMDEKTEERLLKNQRAHRLKGLGICSDFTKCQNDILACLDDCDNFIPDADYLDYFKEQIEVCNEKIQRFKNNKQLKENIEYNKSLYVKVVNKIEKTLEKNKERVG